MLKMILDFFKNLFAIKRSETPEEIINEVKKTSDLPWMIVALGELGVKEIVGSKHNPRILEYHATTTFKGKADEVPWCSSFVNWCFAQCKMFRTHSAGASSWLMWGIPINEPKYGCVGIKSRDGGNHVFFFIRKESRSGIDGFIALGGNQGNEVCYHWYPMNTIRGWRWPQDYPLD